MINLFRCQENNFGDNLSSYLTDKISALPMTLTPISTIGSILEWVPPHTIVWGTGYQRANPTVPTGPLDIRAVRGKLTRDLLIQQGFDCPEVYGDPALLLPRYYKPEFEHVYRVGVLPHYVDHTPEVLAPYIDDEDALIINVRDSVESIIDRIVSCKRIITSSLHGLIVADAYGIPVEWVEWSDKVIGDGFKFRDYFSVRGEVDLDALMEACPFKGDSQ